MGQYFVPLLIDDCEQKKTFYAHAYLGGLKLTEHSLIGHPLMSAVLHELVNTPHKVWWVGDYCDLPKESKEDTFSGKYDVSPTEDNAKWIYGNAYLINLDKDCYIKLSDYDNERWQICPLSILTALGNGRGSGDYFGNNGSEFIGAWAGDRLMVTFSIDKDIADKMLDITDICVFDDID